MTSGFFAEAGCHFFYRNYSRQELAAFSKGHNMITGTVALRKGRKDEEKVKKIYGGIPVASYGAGNGVECLCRDAGG